MGNCVRGQQPAPCADDDDEWEWAEGTHWRRHFGGEVVVGEEDEHGQLKREGEAAQPATEVRIKISKRKLEELLRKEDAQGLPLHLVLAHLVSGADDLGAFLGRGRQWRPALHSISEMAE